MACSMARLSLDRMRSVRHHFVGWGEGCDDQGCGTVSSWRRTPGGWTNGTLSLLEQGRILSDSELVFDGAGNLYGTTTTVAPVTSRTTARFSN